MLTQSIAGVVAGKEIRDVLTTTAFTTVADAAAMMSHKGVGAIVVRTGSGPIEGIFTERDLLSRVVSEGRDPKTTKIATVMSPDVRAVPSDTTIADALRLMVEHRYRHLLVRDGDVLVGLISIRDLMFAQIMGDKAPPHEGRPGVLRARTEEALRAIQPLERAGPT
jgi:CBS domain-containing protein